MSDPEIAEKIVNALEIQKGDIIIEVGPGEGFLTKELAKHPVKIIAAEKDEQLAEDLREWAADEKIKNLEIVKGDILQVLPGLTEKRELKAGDYKIAGNIPYYITGKLLRTVGEMENKPRLTALTVQKEVAERICATPPKMNLLAAAVGFWATAKIIGYIPAKHFRPVPKVDSAVIALTTRAKRLTKREEECYYKFIKAAFAQPRKTLLNNLSAGLDMKKPEAVEIIKTAGFPAGVRSQELSVEDLQKLSDFKKK